MRHWFTLEGMIADLSSVISCSPSDVVAALPGTRGRCVSTLGLQPLCSHATVLGILIHFVLVADVPDELTSSVGETAEQFCSCVRRDIQTGWSSQDLRIAHYASNYTRHGTWQGRSRRSPSRGFRCQDCQGDWFLPARPRIIPRMLMATWGGRPGAPTDIEYFC